MWPGNKAIEAYTQALPNEGCAYAMHTHHGTRGQGALINAEHKHVHARTCVNTAMCIVSFPDRLSSVCDTKSDPCWGWLGLGPRLSYV